MRVLLIMMRVGAAAACDRISTDPGSDSGLFSSTFYYNYIPGSRD
jgi:hypothetical protein